MRDASITFFPVGNGNLSLIRLTDSTDVVIDCNVRDPNGNETCYDVHHHLLQYVKELNDVPFIDAFILTHADEDHCRGFSKIFYAGDPTQYGDAHKKDGLIRINELWFTPRLFSDYEEKLCDDAAALLKEAERRIDLYRSGNTKSDMPGNRIRIIGYGDSADLEGLEGIISIPGQETRDFDGNSKNDCTFFIHAPFKADTDAENGERNNTSIVLQARFDIDDQTDACLVMFTGDADYTVWEHIVDMSDDDSLAWDLFLAPHHCSWTFFNVSGVDEPHEKSMEILRKGRKGAKIIASCKPIRDDDNNPPSYHAKQIYVDTVGEKNFHVTSETPNEDDPKPLVFIMSKNGPVLDDSSDTSTKISSSAAARVAVGNPRTYG